MIVKHPFEDYINNVISIDRTSFLTREDDEAFLNELAEELFNPNNSSATTCTAGPTASCMNDFINHVEGYTGRMGMEAGMIYAPFIPVYSGPDVWYAPAGFNRAKTLTEGTIDSVSIIRNTCDICGEQKPNHSQNCVHWDIRRANELRS